jgi:hypothetical protein
VVTIKNAVYSDVTPCGSCKSQRFGGKYRLHLQDDKIRRAKNNVSCNWQPKHAAKKIKPTNVVPSSPILVTLMMGAIYSLESPVLTRTTRRDIPVDGILQAMKMYAGVDLRLNSLQILTTLLNKSKVYLVLK